MRVRRRVLTVLAATSLLCTILVGGATAATATVSCVAIPGIMTVTVGGTASVGDALTVTTDGGDYQVDLDGAAVCTDTAYSDSESSTVDIDDETGKVPATFIPGSDAGVTFVGPDNPSDFPPTIDAATLDASGVGTGATIDLSTDPDSTYVDALQWSAGSDVVRNVSTVIGAATGGTTFESDGSLGTYTIQGQGDANLLDLSSYSSWVDVNLTTGEVDTPGGDYAVSDITTFKTGEGADDFEQSAPGSFHIDAGPGDNSLAFSNVGLINVAETARAADCDTGYDGHATGAGIDDIFECISAPIYTGPPPNPKLKGRAVPGGVFLRWKAAFGGGDSDVYKSNKVYCSTGPTLDVSGTPTKVAVQTDELLIRHLVPHTMYQCAVREVNKYGTGPRSNILSVEVLGKAPTLKITSALIPLGKKLTVDYSANDSISPVASYDVRYGVEKWNGGFGNWKRPSAWQQTKRLKESLVPRPGHEYCFSARATDQAGDVSDWSKPRCSLVPLDDRSLTTHGSGWSRSRAAAAYRGTLTTTSVSGDTIGLGRATFDVIVVIVTTCPSCGEMAITVDGQRKASYDLHSARTRYRRIAVKTTRLDSGSAGVEVISSGKPVEIDGLGVGR